MEYKEIKTPKELLKFMEENIVSGYITKDGKKYTDTLSKEWQDNWYSKGIVQTGLNVLKTKIGTCWDQVELERLWFKQNNYQFKTIFIIFSLDKINNLPTHTFLIYKELNKYYWFEHSFYNNRGIHEFNSYKEAIDYVKKKQFEYVVSDYKIDKLYYELLEAYQYQEIKHDLTIPEYLDWVTKEKELIFHY